MEKKLAVSEKKFLSEKKHLEDLLKEKDESLGSAKVSIEELKVNAHF